MQRAADEPEIPVAPPGELELPSDDGEPMETIRHRQEMILLIQSLKRAWQGRHDYFVGGNMFVYFSEAQITRNDFRGPDVFVVLDTNDRQDRRSWVAWGEGGKLPDVVIELLSDRTRHVDRGEKMHIYSRVWKTNEYFLYDPWSHEFEGYRLDSASGEYRPIAPDARGDLASERLGLGLGLREGVYEGVSTLWLRWIDASGQPLATPEEGEMAAVARLEEERRRAEEERRRAEEERRRAEEAERRLAELSAKLENH